MDKIAPAPETPATTPHHVQIKTLADISAESLDRAFVPHFTVQSVAAIGASKDGSRAIVALTADDGGRFSIEFPTAETASLLGGIEQARDLALAVTPSKVEIFTLTGWKTWELGTMADGGVALIFDKGTPRQKAFAFNWKTAREIGRACINVARRAETIASRIVRN